ncbi:hypothetical protein [Haloechinothrix salitolerans]|uniref:Uncharacterized protein n=1 Tax=Haloechinothrix salitolerans TaxID=926830 RepID=A0ABW2C3C7_9PSEU
MLRLNAWISERAALSIALAVVLVALSQRVSGWAFGTTAGLLLASLGGLALARQLPWSVPRRTAVTGITVGLLLSTVFLTMYIVHAQQEKARQERAEQIAREELMARAMPRTPQALVRSFLGNVADLDVHRVCVWRLSDTARQQFTEAWRADDCPAAVRAMHAEIRDIRTYVSDMWPPADIFIPRTAGQRVHADACQLEWSNILTGSPLTPPGPQLGKLMIERQHRYGYQVVSYHPC